MISQKIKSLRLVWNH